MHVHPLSISNHKAHTHHLNPPHAFLDSISRSNRPRNRQDYLGWSLDFTGPQMILTIKLSSFAYNVYDGTVDKDVISTPQVSK